MPVGLDPIRVSNSVRQFIKNHFSFERNMPPMENAMQVLDICVATHRDKEGNVKAHRRVVDVITNTGLAEIAGLILADISGQTAFDIVGIGTSDATAQATNDGLTSEAKRKAGTGTRETTTVTNDTAQIVATFSSADGLSGTMAIKEAIIANMTTTGITLCRQTFAALNVDWDAGDSVEITEKVVLSGA
jgi:hypothetical protein